MNMSDLKPTTSPMTTVHAVQKAALKQAARLLGQVRTRKKAAAARRNGRRGGRPVAGKNTQSDI